MTPVSPVTVVKLGGSLLENRDLRFQALEAIAARASAGEPLVVVHGGGKEIDRYLSALGIPRRIQGGLRVTDAMTLDVVIAVLAGTVNKTLVMALRERGVTAAGISGVDAETFFAEFHKEVDGVDLGYVGRIVRCHTKLVKCLLDAGLLPVIASIAAGRDGVLFNVNADAAASALAGALSARRLIFFTDVEGVRDATGAVAERLTAPAARALLKSPAVQGGMRPKLAACLEALDAGVGEVVIAGPERHASVLVDGKGGTHLVAA
jgi:acetylglutamate kinase